MRAVFALLMTALLPIAAQAESFDVAPTTLDLTPGQAGLFYVANRGREAVTVQLQPMDWKQSVEGDTRAASSALLVSPQFATIQPGARQSVRVMSKEGGAGEQPYRLVVSQMPNVSEASDGVHVLLQFSVPVFAGHDRRLKPALAFKRASVNGKPVLEVSNSGSQTVKLTQLAVNGVPQPGDSFFYVLPGATRRLAGTAVQGLVTARDERTGADISSEIAAN